MKTLISLVSAGALFYALGWFISFQTDPYTFCEDHPKKELTENYYLCQPFDFTLKKGILENHNTAIKRHFTGDRKKKSSESGED